MDRIEIKSLGLKRFRNYDSFECLFNQHIIVITGLNGAGKTSILDAIYYLSNGKSYFSHLDSHLYKKGNSYFHLRSQHSSGDDKYNIEISSSREKGKQIKLEEKALKNIADYVGRFPAFMIAPKDILILIDSSVERRKLMDRTISQVDRVYFGYLLSYNKLLKQRNAALKSFLKTGRSDSLILDAFDNKMKEPAEYIYDARKKYLNSISPIISELYKRISSQNEEIIIQYKSSLQKKSWETLMLETRKLDMLSGKSNIGIHRDDLKIYLDGMDIRKVGSQGQLKSAIVAMKMAQVEWVKSISQKIPLVLLDDIFDKLDKNRVENLIDICARDMNAQVFISDTEPARVSECLKKLGFKCQHIHITGDIDEDE